MKKILSFLLIVCLVVVLLAGCSRSDSNGSGGENNNNVISSTAPEPSKDAVTLEQYKEKLEDVSEYVFTTEINTTKEELTLFPYQGLVSCGLTKESNVNVATFLEFDSVESADFIINDTIANNTSGYEEEKGKNFIKLTQDYVVIERVDKTVLITSTDNKDTTEAILNAIGY